MLVCLIACLPVVCLFCVWMWFGGLAWFGWAFVDVFRLMIFGCFVWVYYWRLVYLLMLVYLVLLLECFFVDYLEFWFWLICLFVYWILCFVLV